MASGRAVDSPKWEWYLGLPIYVLTIVNHSTYYKEHLIASLQKPQKSQHHVIHWETEVQTT